MEVLHLNQKQLANRWSVSEATLEPDGNRQIHADDQLVVQGEQILHASCVWVCRTWSSNMARLGSCSYANALRAWPFALWRSWGQSRPLRYSKSCIPSCPQSNGKPCAPLALRCQVGWHVPSVRWILSESWFALSRADQAEALEVAAGRTGRPADLLEKDIWVAFQP